MAIPQDSHFGQLDSNADATCEINTHHGEKIFSNMVRKIPHGNKEAAYRKPEILEELARELKKSPYSLSVEKCQENLLNYRKTCANPNDMFHDFCIKEVNSYCKIPM